MTERVQGKPGEGFPASDIKCRARGCGATIEDKVDVYFCPKCLARILAEVSATAKAIRAQRATYRCGYPGD